jgi:hypothetical protein
MKKNRILLRAAGFINLAFIAFHLAFYQLFNWGEDLTSLTLINKAIFLTYHVICILFLLFMASVSLFQSKTLLESKLRNSVLIFFIGFYLTRIVCEFVFFGITSSSPAIIILCLIPIIFYAIPLINPKKNHEL